MIFEGLEEYVEQYDELFEVEVVEIEDYDADGNLIDVREWYAAVNRLIPEQCFPVKDKDTAEELCKCLNSISDLGSPVTDNLLEWSKLITGLSEKEKKLLELKDIIFDKEQWIIENTDFKKVYGKNNADVRKQHFQKHMKNEYENRRSLELEIDYLKRRISFLKQLVVTKTVLLDV